VLLLTTALVLAAGVAWGGMPGLWVAMSGAALGNVAQWAWLRHRTPRRTPPDRGLPRPPG
jgi:hypothetical protein